MSRVDVVGRAVEAALLAFDTDTACDVARDGLLCLRCWTVALMLEDTPCFVTIIIHPRPGGAREILCHVASCKSCIMNQTLSTKQCASLQLIIKPWTGSARYGAQYDDL